MSAVHIKLLLVLYCSRDRSSSTRVQGKAGVVFLFHSVILLCNQFFIIKYCLQRKNPNILWAVHPVGNRSTSCYRTAESVTTPECHPTLCENECVCGGVDCVCLHECLYEFTFVCLWLRVSTNATKIHTSLSVFCVCVCLWRGEEVHVCVCKSDRERERVRERERERERGEAWPTYGKAHRMSMKLPNITPELLSTEPRDWLLSAPAWQQHWHHPGGGGGERERERERRTWGGGTYIKSKRRKDANRWLDAKRKEMESVRVR